MLYQTSGRNLADVVNALEATGPCVIDVAANIGDTAILLARFTPGARVFCVEGDPRFPGGSEMQ